MSTRDEALKSLRSSLDAKKDAEYEKHRHGYLCPRCEEPMVERTNRRTGESFFGCSEYPDCEGTRDENGECDEDFGEYEDDDPDFDTAYDWGDK